MTDRRKRAEGDPPPPPPQPRQGELFGIAPRSKPTANSISPSMSIPAATQCYSLDKKEEEEEETRALSDRPRKEDEEEEILFLLTPRGRGEGKKVPKGGSI